MLHLSPFYQSKYLIYNILSMVVLIVTLTGLIFAILVSNSAHAQPSEEPVLTDEPIQDSDEEEELEEIIVTGSKLRRTSFNSISPLHIIDANIARAAGVISATDLLQDNTAAAGPQVDTSYSNFVVDNGPGAAQVGLRGLDPSRTLVLLNGKRLSNAGVEGAPVSADTNLIPGALIETIEIVLDGTSSVYGSDAVAGTINILLRKDFEGLRFQGSLIQPQINAAEQQEFSVAWGTTGERSSFSIAAAYYQNSKLTAGDLRNNPGCEEYYEEDENGVIRQHDISNLPGTTASSCVLFPLGNRISLRGHVLGSVYRTPGYTNVGIPNFSESFISPRFIGFNPTIASGVDIDGDGVIDGGIIDGNGDGVNDVDIHDPFYNWNRSANALLAEYIPQLQRVTVFSQLEHELNFLGNATLFGELLYTRRDHTHYNGSSTQLFEFVGINNPTNPCGISNTTPFRCWEYFSITYPDGSRLDDPVEARPILNIHGDRDNNATSLQMFRIVAGIEGDLTFLNNDSGYGNWGYEVYLTQTNNNGTSTRTGILEAELLHSLDTTVADADGNLSCPDFVSSSGTTKTCVPVNLFADNLYQEGGGFLTNSEEEYLFGDRIVNTKNWQTIVSVLVQGDVWELPWNKITVPIVFGYEYRLDSIRSNSNDVAREGLLWGFFNDSGAFGDRNFHEAYFETEFTLLNDRPLAEELTLNLAARYTNESTYGGAFTYSVKAGWRPAEWMVWNVTYGTSFRAPSAREQFLAGVSGFTSLSDPCLVPEDARVPSDPGDPTSTPVYDPAQETRTPENLINCANNGVNPTTLGLVDGTLLAYSTEVVQQGGEVVRNTINPETSNSFTAGVFLTPKFEDQSFNLNLGTTYWEINIKDSISQLAPQSVINFCYLSLTVESRFCSQINREPVNADGSGGLFDIVNYSFRNFNSEEVSGVDINLLVEKEFIINDRALELTFDMTLTRILKNEFRFEEDDSIIDSLGRTGFSELRGVFTFAAAYNNLRFRWFSRYISDFQDPEFAFNTNGSTCRYIVPDVACRPVTSGPDYWEHTTSLEYVADNSFSLTIGISNVFDALPPKTGDDPYNIPLGSGYDVEGRTFFLNTVFRM